MHKPDPEPPLRLVLDTNAALDALLFADARIAPAVRALEQRSAIWLASPPMREELARVLTRPALARYSPDGERILTEFDRMVSMVTTESVVGSPRLVCRDPDDQAFIDLAFHHRPAVLLTQDRDLLALARRAMAFDVTVLRPQQFTTAVACAPGAGGRTDSRC